MATKSEFDPGRFARAVKIMVDTLTSATNQQDQLDVLEDLEAAVRQAILDAAAPHDDIDEGKSACSLRRKDSGRDKERAANADDLQRIADKLDAFDPSDEDADPTEQQGKLDAIEKELDDMGEPDDDQTEERDAIAALRETIAAAQDVIDKRPDNRGEDDPHVEAGSGDVEVGSYERNGHTVSAYSRSRRGGKSARKSAHDFYS